MLPALAAPLIGAGVGFLGSLFGGKPDPKRTTQTFTPDAGTLAQLEAYRRAAANQYKYALDQSQLTGSPLSRARSGYSTAAGMLPFAMQTGTTGIEQFFDPYLEDVLGGVQRDFGQKLYPITAILQLLIHLTQLRVSILFMMF